MKINNVTTVSKLDKSDVVQKVSYRDFIGEHEEIRVRRSPKIVLVCHDVVNDAVLLQYRTSLNSMAEGYYIPEIIVEPQGSELESSDALTKAVSKMTNELINIKSSHECYRLNADTREFAPVSYVYCQFDSRQVGLLDTAEWATTPASLIIQKMIKGQCESIEEFMAGVVLKNSRYQ